MGYAYSFLQKNLFHIRYVAKFLILLLLPYLIGKLKNVKKVEKIIKRIPKAKLSHLTCPIRSMSGSTILSYISILKGYDVHGGDEGDLCDHPFKALGTLVSVHLELILYQKTCTRIWFGNNV